MPNDPNNPNSNGPQNIIVNKISANQQDVSNMSVQRLNVATGEEKTGETDLLNEVRNAITTQTETLVRMLSSISSGITAQTNSARSADAATIGELRANTVITGQQKSDTGDSSASTSESSKILAQLRELNNNLLVAVAGSSSSAGAEGGGVGVLTPSGIRSRAKIFGVVDSIAYKLTGLGDNIQEAEKLLSDENRSRKKQLVTLLRNSANEQLQTNISNIIRSMQRFSSSLVATSNITNEMSNKFKSSASMAETGVISRYSAIKDFAPGFTRGGDNLSATFDLVRNSINNNMISPIGVMGTSLKDVSHNLRQARLTLRDGGATALDRMSFNTSNEAMTALLDVQRRSNVNASLTNSATLTNMRHQLDLAQMIASNTGRTAAEVIKSNQQNQSEQGGMVAAGILSPRVSKALLDAQTVFKGRNQNTISDLLQKIARAGGSVNALYASNDALRQDMSVMGKDSLFRQLVATAKAGKGNLSQEAYSNRLERLYKQFGTNRFTGKPGARRISDLGIRLANEAGLSADYIKPKTDKLQALLKKGEDFLANIAPTGELGLAAALIGNTKAVWINTAALLKGVIGFGAGKIYGGIKWLGRGALNVGKGLLGIGGAVAGGAAVEGAVAGGTIAGGAAIAGGTVVAGGGLLYGSGKTLGRVMGKSSATISKGATALGRGAAAIGEGGVMAAEATSGLAKGAAAIGKGAITASKVGLVAGKVGLGATLRALPLIGVVAGLGYGAYKAYKGDYVGAGLSVAAGLAGGLEPGVGTAASVGLSAALAAHEMGVLAPVGDKSISVGKIATGANANVYGPKYSPVPKTDSIQMTPLKFMIDVSKSLNDLVDIGNKDILLQQTIAKNTGSNDISTKPSLWDSIMGPSPDAKNTAAFSK